MKIAIVGAGPAGLSAAWRLERLGVRDYRVFDLEARAGGTSTYGTDGAVPHPWGAHYVPVPTADNPGLRAILDEMGVLEPNVEPPRARERFRIRAPEERIFVDGAWHEGLFPGAGASEGDFDELERFTRHMGSWAARRDAAGRRAFTIPVAGCSRDAEVLALDRITAAQYLDREGYRSSRLRWYVEYACRDDYGTNLETTSAWAMIFYFAARLSGPGAPSQPFVAWPEGNGRIVRHLTRVVGDRLHLRQLATDVVPRDGRVSLSVFDAHAGALERVEADHAILAVPDFVARRIYRPFRERPPASRPPTYSPWMVANIHLRRAPTSRGFPLAWDNVLYDSPSLGYVAATHQTLADTGRTIWTYYHPFVDSDPRAARQRLLEADHSSICDSVLADLSRAHQGLEDAVERIDVWRWGHAMVRPTPRTVTERNAVSRIGRTHFAHTDMSGVALFEEAQFHGVTAAEAAAAAVGRSFEPLFRRSARDDASG